MPDQEMGEAPKRDEDEDDDDISDHVRVAWGHIIAAPALVGFVIAAPFVHRPVLTLLLASSVVACLPLVVDALLVPRFRRGAHPQKGLSIPGTTFFIAAPLSSICAYGIAANDVGDDVRQFGVGLAGLICAAISMVAVVLCLRSTAERRRLIAAATRAAPHRHPPQDGERGALDGRLEGTTHNVGHERALVSTGMQLVVWGGGDTPNISETPFSNMPMDASLVTDRGARVTVRFGDASWLTLVHLEQSTHSTSVGDHAVRADLIGPEHSVRVVGRVRDGGFVDEGPGSVIIIAAVRNVRHSIRVLHMRDQASFVLAVIGMACLLGAVVMFAAGAS